MFDAERIMEKRRQTVEEWLRGHGIVDMRSFEETLKREDLYANSSLRQKVEMLLSPKAVSEPKETVLLEEEDVAEQISSEESVNEEIVSAPSKKNKKVIIPKQ